MRKLFKSTIVSLSLIALMQACGNIQNNQSSQQTVEEKNKEQVYPEDTCEYVDLVLPSGTLWATHNIGADRLGDYGHFFSWGETTQKQYYLEENYKWWRTTKGKTIIIKYKPSEAKIELEPEDDAAHVNMGKEWKIPSEEQFKELCDTSLCTWKWAKVIWYDDKMAYGYRVFSKKNGKSIFLPVTGYLDNLNPGLQHYNEDGGYYWTNTLDIYSSHGAMSLYFDSTKVIISPTNRYPAHVVRPVRLSKE